MQFFSLERSDLAGKLPEGWQKLKLWAISCGPRIVILVQIHSNINTFDYKFWKGDHIWALLHNHNISHMNQGVFYAPWYEWMKRWMRHLAEECKSTLGGVFRVKYAPCKTCVLYQLQPLKTSGRKRRSLNIFLDFCQLIFLPGWVCGIVKN